MGAARHSFGGLLKQHRLAAGISQEELAGRARLSVKTIGALETGARQKPYRDTIAVLADALQLSWEARTELEQASARRSSVTAFPSLETLSNNLPTQLSSFVGRANDVSQIDELMLAHRLVTLVGAGGIGKTRIALHVAANVLNGTGEGVWFVDFAPLSDASLVPNAIASALSVQESASRPLLETLVTYLKNKHLLLVFDNCEHVVEHAARVADTILRLCQHVQILATSREALAIDGEQIYHVPPLSVPPPDAVREITVDEALTYGAVALFVDRAADADSRFVLTAQLVPTVLNICRRLDGIALAIELAAARVSSLSATTLAQMLFERFLMLTGGSRTAVPRHKTMGALLDWSYDLLNAQEQLLLRRLSIFAGGFTLEMVTAMCAEGDLIVEGVVFESLLSLVDKSLVQSEVTGDTTRYRLLESTRQYAREKLREHGEYPAVARAQALALLALAERFDSPLRLTPDVSWAVQVPELDNWRAAMEWAFGPEGDPHVGQRLAGSLSEVWPDLAPEAPRWVRAALQTCGDATAPQVRARLELAQAQVETRFQRPEASLAAAERALVLYEEAGDPLWIAAAQLLIAQALIFTGRLVEGESLARAALAVARPREARKLVAFATHTLGLARHFAWDFEAARALLHEALTLYKTAGGARYAGTVANGLAEVEFRAGNVETALKLAREAVELLLSTANNRFHLELAFCNCSAYLVALARFDEAQTYALESLQLSRDAGSNILVAIELQHLAAIAALRTCDNIADHAQDLQVAARMLGFVNARLADLEYVREFTEQQEYDRTIAVLQDAVGDEIELLMSEGRSWNEDDAFAEALRI